MSSAMIEISELDLVNNMNEFEQELLEEAFDDSLSFVDLISDDDVAEAFQSSSEFEKFGEDIDRIIIDGQEAFQRQPEIVTDDDASDASSIYGAQNDEDAASELSASLEEAMTKLDECMRRTARSRSLITMNVPSIKRVLSGETTSSMEQQEMPQSQSNNRGMVNKTWHKVPKASPKKKTKHMKATIKNLSLKSGLLKSSLTGVKSRLHPSAFTLSGSSSCNGSKCSISDFLRQSRQSKSLVSF